MKSFGNLTTIFFGILYIGLLFPGHAHAYLDPGTGSYFLQVFLAALFGALFALKIFWKKISVFLKGIFNKPKE